MTDLALMPAACYPVYPAIAARSPLAAGGVFIEAGGAWVFRHEPSDDPARRQMFRQHELVRLGAARDRARAGATSWAERGLSLLRAIGLDAELDTASDPFFGRRGRMLATSQREQSLKLEILVPDRRAGADRGGLVQPAPRPLHRRLRHHAVRAAARPTAPAWASATSASCLRCCARTASTRRAGRRRCATTLRLP